MALETCCRDRGVLTDEVKSLKLELDALKKRMADMDRDNRKLAPEREELARAYKDADAGKQKANDRVAILEKELAKMKAEFEKKFGGARDEFEVMKKKLVGEINILTRKLTDSENRLKVEVEGIKKKMAITITELEMSAAYDDVNKKLGGSLQQYDITIKRLTAIELEFKSLTVNYNNSIKIVKDYEGKMGGLTKQVTELTSANNNFSQYKIKIEKELALVTRDYQDIAKELKLADDRANKAGADAGHFESLL